MSPSQPSANPAFNDEALRVSLVYKKSAPLSAVQADLVAIKSLDLKSQSNKWLWGTLGVLSFLSIPVSLFVAFGVGVGVSPSLGVLVPISAGLVFLFFCYQFYQSQRTDVENRRYELPTQLLHYLSADMAADEPIEIEIDFNTYHQPKHRTAQESSWFSSESSSSYEQPWLRMRGKFLDGNRFRLESTLQVKRKEKRKRKYTKVREEFGEELQLTLQIRRSDADLQKLSDALLAMAPPPHLVALRPRFSGDRLSLTADTSTARRLQGRGGSVTGANAIEQAASVHCYLALFMAAYNLVNRAAAQT